LNKKDAFLTPFFNPRKYDGQFFSIFFKIESKIKNSFKMSCQAPTLSVIYQSMCRSYYVGHKTLAQTNVITVGSSLNYVTQFWQNCPSLQSPQFLVLSHIFIFAKSLTHTPQGRDVIYGWSLYKRTTKNANKVLNWKNESKQFVVHLSAMMFSTLSYFCTFFLFLQKCK